MKQAAIARMGMGTLDKLYLRFEKRSGTTVRISSPRKMAYPEASLTSASISVSMWTNQLFWLLMLGQLHQLSRETDNLVVDKALQTLAGVYM